MPNFIDCWGALKSKGYKHADGSPVLNDADKASIMNRIREHVQTGIDPLEAAKLSVKSHMDEVHGQLQSVYDQVGVKPPQGETGTKPVSPAGVEYAASNPNPGFVKFPNGKLVKVRDEAGNYTKEFLSEGYKASMAKQAEAGGTALLPKSETGSGPVSPTEAVAEQPKIAEPATAIGKPVEEQIPAAPEGGGEVGLTKEFISKDREARGEEPLAEQARKTDKEAWSKSEQVFGQNPNAGHELVAQLTEKPRPLTEDDLAVLLRHRVNLQNQTDFEAQRLFSKETPEPDKASSLLKLNALQDARNEADNVTRQSGAQAGRTMRFLQKLSNEDYTLSGMAQQARIAQGGKPPTELQMSDIREYNKELLEKDRAWQNYLKEDLQKASALKGYKTRLKTATTEYERRAAFQDFEPQIRRHLELDPEAVRLQGDFQRAKIDWQKQLIKYQAVNKPVWQKILSGVSYLAREGALSGYHTLAKLASFTGARLAEVPLTETAERMWGQIPGFNQLAAKSEFGPGANARQLGIFYRDAFTTGMKGAIKQLRTGESDVRAAYSKEAQKPRAGYSSFFGNIHGAEKTPLLTGSFGMYRAKLMDQGLEQLAAKGVAEGSDITSEPVKAAINYKAFQAATHDILQEQNMFADGINGFLRRMEAPSKVTGEVSPEKATLAAIIRTFATKGIVRTPANYVMQTIDRTPIGLIRGVGRAGRAFYKDVDNVHPAEASAIMKLMGVGSVGSAMFVWGALDAMKSPDKRIFGGYYQPGDKRGSDDVPFAAIRIGGKTLSHFLTHNPMTESAQMGATMMRVALSSMSKKDRQNKGFIRGIIASVFGLAEQAPIANPIMRAGEKIRDPRTSGSFVGEQIRGLEPMLIQNIASDTDQAKSRKPETIMDTAKLGIPGLRQQVQEKKSKEKSGAIKAFQLPK